MPYAYDVTGRPFTEYNWAKKKTALRFGGRVVEAQKHIPPSDACMKQAVTRVTLPPVLVQRYEKMNERQRLKRRLRFSSEKSVRSAALTKTVASTEACTAGDRELTSRTNRSPVRTLSKSVGAQSSRADAQCGTTPSTSSIPSMSPTVLDSHGVGCDSQSFPPSCTDGAYLEVNLGPVIPLTSQDHFSEHVRMATTSSSSRATDDGLQSPHHGEQGVGKHHGLAELEVGERKRKLKNKKSQDRRKERRKQWKSKETSLAGNGLTGLPT